MLAVDSWGKFNLPKLVGELPLGMRTLRRGKFPLPGPLHHSARGIRTCAAYSNVQKQPGSISKREGATMKYGLLSRCVSRGGTPELYTSTMAIAGKLGLELEEILCASCTGAGVLQEKA